MKQVKIIEDQNKWEFEAKINEVLEIENVIDIKFSVTTEVTPNSFGVSYSSGETYYAMVIIEK